MISTRAFPPPVFALSQLALGLALSLGAAALPAPALAQGTAGAAGAGQHSFDIPAGPLQAALERFAATAGVNLSYGADTVRGASTQGLRGSHGVEAGLQALLAGSGVQARPQDNGGFVLRRLTPGEVSTLPTVTVQGGGLAGGTPPPFAGGQVATGARLGMLGNRDIMQTPFSVTSYTVDNIENQQATSIAEALIADPSVRTSGARGAESEAFTIRGFPVDSLDVAVNGLYGIAPTYRSSIEYAERVEVIKGPTALLSGMSPSGTVGGGINIVTKRAGDTPLTRLTTSYVSDGQVGGHLDLGRRFGEDDAFGIRFNGAYRNGDTPLDHQKRERGIGALGLDYRGDRLRLSADLIYQQENIDGLTRSLSLAPGLSVPDAPDARTNLGQRWEYSKMNNQAAMTRAEYDFSDQVMGYATVGISRGIFKSVTGNPQILDAAGDTSAFPALAQFEFRKRTAEAGLQATFDTGPVSHVATVSATVYTDRQGYAFSFADGPIASNIYDPVRVDKPAFGPLGDIPTVSRQQLTSLALADTLSVLDGRGQLTLGVRQQRVRTTNYDSATGDTTSRYDEDAVTPLVGVLVRPWQHVALYANYTEGLSVGGTAPQNASNAGQAFAPFKSRQYEAGVKLEHGDFGATLSAFQITRPSANLDPIGGGYAINGKQRNRGLELNAFGEATRGLRVLGGVVLYDARLTRNPDASLVGNHAIGVPDWQANLGVEWDVPAAPGLTMTGNVLYTAKQYVNQSNSAELPAWTRVDAGLRYRTRIGEHDTVFRFAVQNLFDRDYWAGVFDYGSFYGAAPRTFLLSATIDF